IAQANPMVIGDVVTGTIATTTDLDIFSVPIITDPNLKVTVQLDGDPERDGVQFDGNLDILNSAGAIIDHVDNSSVFGGGLVSEAVVYTTTVFSTTGTYYVQVTSDSSPAGGLTTGSYNLHTYLSPKLPCGNTPTPSFTAAPTNTSTPTLTRTITSTPTNTPLISDTPTVTNTPTNTFTQTSTP